jgi:hypothetical protein
VEAPEFLNMVGLSILQMEAAAAVPQKPADACVPKEYLIKITMRHPALLYMETMAVLLPVLPLQEQEAVVQVPRVAMQQAVAFALEDKAEMVLVHIVHFY